MSNTNNITLDGTTFLKDGKVIANLEENESKEMEVVAVNNYYKRFVGEMQIMVDGREVVGYEVEAKSEDEAEVAPVETYKAESKAPVKPKKVEAEYLDEPIDTITSPMSIAGCPDYDFSLGDKTPAVLEFARKNMTKDQFYKHYNKSFVSYEG